MARKIKLEFPKAEGRYWYLYWPGKIYMENKTYKVDLHFANKYKPDLDNRDFTGTTFTQRVNASSIVYFHIGVIFDSEESVLVDPKTIDEKKVPLKRTFNNMTINTNANFCETKGNFPMVGHSQFPDVVGLDKEDVTFMEYQNRYVNKETTTICLVLITPYCLLEYFFFRNSKLINQILSGQLIDAFKFDELKVVIDPETSKRTAQLPYDNTLINRKNAIAIVPYLFLKDGLGIKMLTSIYSSLHKNFRNNQGKVENVGAYIDIYFTIDKFRMEMEGILYYNHAPVKKKEDEIHKIFLASKIKSFKFFGDDLFRVDQILLIPTSPNKKNESNSEDSAISNNPEVSEEEVAVLDMYPNKSGKSGGNINPDKIESNQTGPFDISVKIESLTGDKRNFINIPSGEEIDGVSTDDWGANYRDDIRVLEQEAQKIQNRITYIDNLTYFSRVVQALKAMGEKKGISINDDPLGIGRENYPYELRTESDNYLIDVVEIQYEGSFLYAVEFGSGFIGVFNDLYSGKINGQNLSNLLEELIIIDKDQSSRVEELKTNKKDEGVRLWTRIYRKYKSGSLDQDIEIKQGVKHQRADESEKKTAFQKTAESILKRFTS